MVRLCPNVTHIYTGLECHSVSLARWQIDDSWQIAQLIDAWKVLNSFAYFGSYVIL